MNPNKSLHYYQNQAIENTKRSRTGKPCQLPAGAGKALDYVNRFPRQPQEPFWPALSAFIGMAITLVLLAVIAAGAPV
ncbi:hypothetical protein KLER11_gp47 [Pararheinheimera phage vB_PsoM_KLER1-1]|nr:hypothetical protein KLER11_gp47 [Pararheinheimera phage vB_PsoM_KLER1-1]